VTVVLVAPRGGELAQDWLERLESRGHIVYLVAPSSTTVRAMHHVTTRGDTADVVRAIADAMEGVPSPVLLLDAASVGSVVTVEEVEAASGTVVLAVERTPASEPVTQGAAAPLRVIAEVVLTAGSGVHQIGEPTHAGLGVLRVDAADADDVAGALRVMADVASHQQWHVDAWSLTVVAAVRAGVTVRTVSAPGLPWGAHADPQNADPQDPDPLDVEQERRLRVDAAAGAPQGVVDRMLGRRVAESVAMVAWRAGVGAHAVTVVSVAAALLAGLLIATGTRTGAAVAALFLLLSVLLDRVDGMLARARRTVTAFGAWLDVTSDRLREAALVIGLAFGAAQFGTPRWGLATAVLAALTLAHLAAAASRTARGWGGTPVPIRLPLDRLEEPALPPIPPPPGRPVPAWLPFSVSRGDGAVLTVVGLLVLPADNLLAVLAVVAGVSAVAGLLYVGAPRPLPAAQAELLEQADPGPVARLVGRQDPQLSLLRRALATRAAAWVPPFTWVVESAVVLVAAAVAQPDALPITLAWIGVVAFHRLDISTRQRVLGSAPPAWIGAVGLGALGRSLVVVVLAVLGVLTVGLAAGAVLLGVLYAAESSGRFAER